MQTPEVSIIAARGVVTGIRMGEPIGTPISVTARAQQRCPRCHGEDLSGAVACPRCDVLSHSNCQPCCSFNCGPLFTRTGTRNGWQETDWQDTPDHWRLTVSREQRAPTHGPIQQHLVRSRRADYSRRIGKIPGEYHSGDPLMVESCDLVPVDYRFVYTYGRWLAHDGEAYMHEGIALPHTTWNVDTVYRVGQWRSVDGTIEIELLTEEEFNEQLEGEEYTGPDQLDWDTYRLATVDSLAERYATYLREHVDPTDYVDSHWIADIAMEALSNGSTIDFGQVWSDEIDSLMENAETEELLGNAFGVYEYEDSPELPDDMFDVLGFRASDDIVMFEGE